MVAGTSQPLTSDGSGKWVTQRAPFLRGVTIVVTIVLDVLNVFHVYDVVTQKWISDSS